MRKANDSRSRRRQRLAWESLEPRQLLAGDLIISEFMARNTETLVDEDGDYPDWIELYNRGDDEVDLSDYYLTDDASQLDKWRFPAQPLGAGNFLLVHASGKDRVSVGAALHTNFKLSSNGESLSLTRDDPQPGNPQQVVSQFTTNFPSLAEDISFGIGQSVTVDTIVDVGDAARLLFPTDGSLGTSWTQSNFSDATWVLGSNAIGYEQSVPGFTVHDAHSTGQLTNIASAQSVLNGTGLKSEATVISAVVNFRDPGGGGGSGNYGNPTAFPNDTAGDDNDFAIRATGTVFIPSAGTWSFGTNSDDGLRLWVDGQLVIDDDSLHAPANRFGQTNLSAGPHSIELVFFERGGGAEVELFAAQGSYSTYNANAFRLVGDVANGGLAVETVPGSANASTGYGGVIQTDVSSFMYNVTPGAYLRIPFQVAGAGGLNSLTLRMRYDDGYVAYVNGVEVARRNAPANVTYDATATLDRGDADALLIEDVDISQHLHLLNVGSANVLAVHGLNDSVSSDEFLSVAELAQVSVNTSADVYFTDPTPGAFNATTGVDGFLIDEIQFSQPHGFQTNPFQLSIGTATSGTSVRYTLDGTEPTASHGLTYTGPVTISQTSTVRARAFKGGLDPSNIETATYLFISDIVRQSPTGTPPAGFPGATSINGQTLDYGMDPDVVNDGTWGPQLQAALTQVPSMSIVMDIDDLLGSSSGIYVNAQNHGQAWERPVSLELIDPNGSAGFQANAGLRIRGGFSRIDTNPKHSFRLFFRDEYGDGKLDFPLFGSEGADEFDKFDLRTTQNYSWAYQGDSRNAFVRDVFSRDVQNQLGQPYTRSRYYHLYINGQYWGLYQTEERPEAAFAASYMGGDKTDYDVVKSTGSNGGYQNEATDGSLQAYRRLADYFYQAGGLSDSRMSDYWRVQGMNSDGTRNASYERLLDVDNLVDYMIITYYTSDADGPGSMFTRPRVNNYFGIFNRESPDGFKFFEHDSEHSLDTGNAAGANYNMVSPLTTGGSDFRYFNPHWMHERLAETNSEYRQRFADRVYGSLFGDGPLTPANAKSIIDSRAAQINMAIIAESARWGDSKRSTPHTKNQWTNAVNAGRNFIDNRRPVVLDQLRSQGWYSDTNPPGVTINGSPSDGGRINSTDALSFFTSGATSFSDIVSAGSTWKYLDDGSDRGTAWRTVGFDDGSWASGAAELGYGDGGESTVVGFGPDGNDKFRTTYFRKSFNVSHPAQYQSLRVKLQRDDGAIVYLNGHEVVRSNMPAGTVRYDDFAAGVAAGGDESTFYNFDIDVSELNTGTNILAVEVHQANAGSSDVSFDLELLGGTFNTGNGNVHYTLDGTDPRMQGGAISPAAVNFDGNPFSLASTSILNVRVRNGNEWSPLQTAEFLVDTPAIAGTLTITEINFHPHDPLPQFGDANLGADQFEFVELTNTSHQRIDLTGVRFVQTPVNGDTEGIDFEFATQTLDPGEPITVVRDRGAFGSRYGNSVRLAEGKGDALGTGVFDGGLNNGGERLTLQDAQGFVIQQFTYGDSGGWPGRADGNGSSLEIIDVAGDYNLSGNWQASNEFGGTPGRAGTGPITDVIVNEILTHTDLPQVDRVEFRNVTSQAIDIGGWYVSDNNANYLDYQFPAGAMIAAGGYRTLDENQLGFGFKGQESDDVWIVASGAGGKPSRFVDHAEFGATQNGVSLGRWPNGQGRLFPMVSSTFGSSNSGPALSQLMISEVHYNAAAPPPGSAITDEELEFVEVYNGIGPPADIGHWRLNKAIDFTFPAGTVLSAGQRAVVVAFDPVADMAKAMEFRQIHGVPANSSLFGPYTGVLDNGGENLELDRPEDTAQLGLGYVLVDRSDYEDQTPWPTSPDGQGASLHRNLPVAYGDFAASWSASLPTPGGGMGAVNADPVVAGDAYVVAEGATLNVSSPGLLLNDSDANGDVLSAQLLTTASHGTVSVNSNGSFRYSHDGSETTNDRFTYRVSDGSGGFGSASVDLTVIPVNDPPAGSNDSYALQEGTTLVIDGPGLLRNDVDADGDALTATVVASPVNGAFTLNTNGGFSYAHDGSQTLSDSLTYRVSDGRGGTDTATVTFSIAPVNDSPVAVGDTYWVNEGATLTVASPGLLDNDLDDDGDSLNATLVSGPRRGTLTLDPDGSFVYVHDGSESVSDVFTYRVADASGSDTATVSVAVRPVNDQPVSVADDYSVVAGDRLSVSAPGVLQNDFDADNGALSAVLASQPSHGSVSLNSDGSFAYVHNGGNAVSDFFTYKSTDGLSESIAVAVNLTILPKALPGDFDRDGVVHLNDVTLLCGQIHAVVPDPGFDISGDGIVDHDDLEAMIVDVLNTSYGDSNLDGRFDSGDLIRIFQAGEYEDGVEDNSTWDEGDWNCDGDFDTADIILAFQSGAYEAPALAALGVEGSLSEIAAARSDQPSLGRRQRLTGPDTDAAEASRAQARELKMQARDLLFAESDPL